MSRVEPLLVVLVEDDEDDALLLRQLLSSTGSVAPQTRWARTFDEAREALRADHDVALVDYRLGGHDGLELIRELTAEGHRAPMILLTGMGDRAVDVLAMEAGAADYLVKGELTAPLLERSIRYAISRTTAAVALKESEARLERSVSLLRATLDASSDGILVTNADGAVAECSRTFKSLCGVPEEASNEDVEARLRIVALHVKQPAQYTAKLAELRANPEMVSDDVIEFQGGRFIERHSQPQRSGGSILGRVWSFREITEKRNLQATLVVSDRLAAMGALAAGVAHEINNPLTYLLANLTILAEDLARIDPAIRAQAGEDLLQVVADARHGADRLRQIVRDLKLFSRTDEVSTGPVDLQRVLESSINMAFHEIRHRARLVKDYGADVPLVEANEGRLGQVFLNLIVNAAQAIPEGRANRNEIRIVTRADERGGAVVEVRDSGEGIAPEALERIFDPFFTTKPLGTGTGLGLSISQSIIVALGGRIEVESEMGKGTSFLVRLPVLATARASRSFPPSSDATAGVRGKVLVVDDDAHVRAVLQRLLDEHEVTLVADGTTALARLTGGEAFDVVLCDLMMPELTGMDLHARISELAPSLVDRMVFMTAGAFTRGARDFLDRVPNERIEKPVDAAALRSVVRRLVAASPSVHVPA
jgi:signal transduction histidine kinase/FixJ family two-component response regulator